MKKKSINRADATALATLGGVLLWICMFVVVFFISLSVWNSEVKSAKHNKHWRKQYVALVEAGIVDNLNPRIRPSYVSYYVNYRYYRQYYLANRDLPLRFHKGDKLLAYVNDSGRLWVKSAEHQWTDRNLSTVSPFDADKRDYFCPVWSDFLGALIAALLAGLLAVGLFDSMEVGFGTYIVYVPSFKKIYKKVRPEPVYEDQRILKHTQGGQLREEMVKVRVR